MIKRALLSVSDKNGVVDFAKRLYAKGIEILATAGTAKLLRANDIDAIDVEKFMESKDITLGRDKTLHPKIHDALAPQKENGKRKNGSMPEINLVAANLIPLDSEKSFSDETLDRIDIGGASLVRNAAKNFKTVTVVTDPEDYDRVMGEIEKTGDTKDETRRRLAEKAFEATALYDSLIATLLTGGKVKTIMVRQIEPLRYGENPHQKAVLYRDLKSGSQGACVPNAEILQGKLLSYNNVLDADAALELVREFPKPCVAFVIHGNPCGVATDEDLNEAFINAYQSDPKSAFGSIIAFNRPCTADLAESIASKFFEGILAPDYEPKALKIFAKKPNLRVLRLGDIGPGNPEETYLKIRGGLLAQDLDSKSIEKSDVKIVSRKTPTQKQLEDLLFAWRVAKHVKSNAMVLAKNGMTVGIGAGQMNQEDSLDLAIRKSASRHKGAALAVDGFIPFPEIVALAAKAGISAILQPGGSIKDEAVIAMADKLGMAMAFTGFRAFRH
jgi:phosphoribosylaminoimidazolecarboxamide formyltransferase/IMP cyclohydrolase